MPSQCWSSPCSPSNNMYMKLTSETATLAIRSKFQQLISPHCIVYHVTSQHLFHLFLVRFIELSEQVMKGGGENAIARHTKRNKKLLVRDRLRLLLDDDDFLELSPFAGLGLPYGDIPSAGCLTGQEPLPAIYSYPLFNIHSL